MTEEWRDVVGFEDYYQVSNLGRVRSKDRVRIVPKGGEYIFKGRVLADADKGDGYRIVNLSVNGKGHMKKVHQLVAMAFIPNPMGYKDVNHKDEVHDHNWVDNLEWCSRKYNANYGTRSQRLSVLLSTPVVQYDKQGNKVAEYYGAAEAARQLGVSSTCITDCIRGRTKAAGGFMWRKKSDAPDKLPPYFIDWYNSKLDYDTVVAIKRDLAEGKLLQKEIAEKYEIHFSIVSLIKLGKTFKDVQL